MAAAARLEVGGPVGAPTSGRLGRASALEGVPQTSGATVAPSRLAAASVVDCAERSEWL